MADEQEQTKAILPFLKVGAEEWLNSLVVQLWQSCEAPNSFNDGFCKCSGLTSCRTPSPRCNTPPLSCRTLPHARQALTAFARSLTVYQCFELAGGLLLSYVRGGHGE